MTHIQDIFGVDTTREFEQLLTACGWTFRYDNLAHSTPISIVCWQKDANTDIRPHVKGLIYNNKTGQIMAPGVPVPLDRLPENPEIVGYSQALDGIMIRFWTDPNNAGHLQMSTNGMIQPGTWRNKQIGHLVKDCEEQFNPAYFNPDLCYYAVLEHPEAPNIYQIDKPRITLVRVADRAGNSVSITGTCPFQYVNEITDVTTANTQPQEATGSGPVTREEFGTIIHLANGDTFRQLTHRAVIAESVRPNYSQTWQHWIYCMMNDCMSAYETHFPWNKQEFFCWNTIYNVGGIGRTEGTPTASKLKETINYYYKIMEEIGCTYRRENGIVSVPHLGDFPDDESADFTIDNYMKHPEELFDLLFNLKFEEVEVQEDDDEDDVLLRLERGPREH